MATESELPDSPSGRFVSVSDRLGVSPASLVGGLLAVSAAAAAGWWALRPPDPPPVETVLPAAAAVPLATPPSSTSVPVPLLVHVDGAVNSPGVHEIRDGQRVLDAVTAAGGMTSEADRARVNLAAPVRDGERIWIPSIDEPEPPVVAGVTEPTPGDPSSAGGRVDVNRADAAQLETLPGIGPALAAAIIEHRARSGPFRVVDDLLEVAGIGPAKLRQIEELVAV